MKLFRHGATYLLAKSGKFESFSECVESISSRRNQYSLGVLVNILSQYQYQVDIKVSNSESAYNLLNRIVV